MQFDIGILLAFWHITKLFIHKQILNSYCVLGIAPDDKYISEWKSYL